MFNLIARKYPNMLGNIPDKCFIPSKSLAKDSFTLRFFNELDIEEALEEWNVLQAALRQAARNSSTIFRHPIFRRIQTNPLYVQKPQQLVLVYVILFRPTGKYYIYRDIPFGCFRILGARCPVRWVLPCWPSDFALWLVWPFWPNMWFSGPTGTWKSWQIGSWIDWNHALSMVFVCFVNFLKQPRGLLIQGWHYMTFPHFYNVSNLCWLVMFVSRIILATFLFKHQGFDKSIPPEMWNRGVHMVLPHHL